jgi:hypothetical protein
LAYCGNLGQINVEVHVLQAARFLSRCRREIRLVWVGAVLIVAAVAAYAADTGADSRADQKNPPPTPADWEALARLPDWSGIWTPDVNDQEAQETGNPPPWTAAAARQIRKLVADEKAGHPLLVFAHCFPEAMPSWMLIMHNAFEFLFTRGRVTMLGEVDGNRMRRIYTDGRGHPADPDPSFHGHSIGHWEGETLVVDTVGILPQTYIAISEAVGVPNDGGMHIVERMHLVAPDTLHDDLEITAPKVLEKPWITTRIYYRHRARKFDLVEGVCVQEGFVAGVDKNGNAIFKAVKFHDGVPQPPDDK